MVAETPTIYFGTTTKFTAIVTGNQEQTLWKREVMRQALLLAARAELGYRTSDTSLGDNTFRSQPSLVLAATAGQPNKIEVLKGNTGNRQPVWSQAFEFNSPWPHHKAWVDRMEQMSRTDFVRALEKAGYTRQKQVQPKDAAAPLDAELVQLIDEDLTFVGQLLALRKLHADIARDGETDARLAGLVRAYAHLGLLTEYQWHPMSYAFKARALLYAQRAVVRQPKSPEARQHRAYAFALVGMHGEALADLWTSSKLADRSIEPFVPAAWTPLIESYCRYDFEGLNRLRGDKQWKPLASLLYFLAHEQEGTQNRSVTVVLELLKEMPDCYRMIDTLCLHTGPGVGHLTSQVGSQHLATTLLPRLEKTKELPSTVRQILDLARTDGAMLTEDSDAEDVLAEVDYRAKVTEALRGSVSPKAPQPDLGEPSWAVLAQLIEETTFLQVYRRVYFVRVQLGFPIDELIDAHRPIIGKHPRFSFIEQYHTQIEPEKAMAATQSFDANYLDYAQARFWTQWPANLRIQVESIARQNREMLANEAGIAAREYHYDANVGVGPLVAVSPHSPYAMGVALRCNPPQPDVLKAWEETAKRSPYLAWSFAEVAGRNGDPTRVEKFLKLAAELDPSAINLKRLAEHYKGSGDNAKWVSTLDEFLKTPSLGLERAQIQRDIAAYYFNRRQWDKALPYADAASETGAQWAMMCARTANEANQNWEAAERHFVDAITRYGESPVEWYLFCNRNGVGNLELARATAFPDGVESFAGDPNTPPNYAGISLYLEAKPSKALDRFEKEAESLPATFTSMHAATIADRLGETSRRNKLFKQVVEQKSASQHPYDNRPHRPELVELAKLFIADLAQGAKCKFSFDKLTAIRDAAPERDRCGFNYFLACYLDQHGQPDLAIDYWKQCMGAADLGLGTRTLAGAALHKRGVKPGDWKVLLFARPDASKQ
jgi:hypothetical protein